MKVGLVIPANEGFQPFVRIFKNILDAQHIDYESIIWDRMNMKESGIVYHKSCPPALNNILKIINHAKFARFATKHIKKQNFDKLIIFSPQLGLFMYPFLKKHYAGKFWFDYRDLSIEQKCMGLFNKLLSISEYITISSPDFKKALPSGYDYVLSHNFDIDEIKATVEKPTESISHGEKISVLTIGSIRNFNENKEVIDALKDAPDMKLRFIGKGIASDALEKYARSTDIKNIEFVGYYNKCEEHTFYEQSDFVNIYYPHVLSHDTALSNRFYKALVFKKPMITRSHSIQGDYATKYALGPVVDSCDNLAEEIRNFNIDSDFPNRCNHLLKEFCEDYNQFYNKFINFISE